MILYKVIAFIILAGMVVCMSAVITTGIQNKNGTPRRTPLLFKMVYAYAGALTMGAAFDTSECWGR